MVDGHAISCEHVWREVSNYLEGDVAPALRAAMEEHFRSCQQCASVLAGTRNVIRLYGDERMIELPAGFEKRLERRLAQQARPASRWLTWEAWLVPVAALALITGGLRLVNSWSRGSQPRSEQAQSGKNIPPDLAVVVAAGTKVFHVPDCIFIHDKPNLRKMTAKEALRGGFTPCPRCLKKYLETTAARLGPVTGYLDAEDQDEHNDGLRVSRQ